MMVALKSGGGRKKFLFLVFFLLLVPSVDVLHVDWYHTDPHQQQQQGTAGLDLDDAFYPMDDHLKLRERLRRNQGKETIDQVAALRMRAKDGPANSHTFPLHDSFRGTYGNLADHLSAAQDLGKGDVALDPRIGAKRKVDRGTTAPRTSLKEAKTRAWNRGDDESLSCPPGMHRVRGLQVKSLRYGPETPLFTESLSCAKCPRGSFSDGGGKDQQCTKCPVGRYGTRTGGTTTAESCAACPANTFGQERGLVDRMCSGRCPLGKYSGHLTGLTTASHCLPCPDGYFGGGCEGSRERGEMMDERRTATLPGYSVAHQGASGFETRMHSIEGRESAWDAATTQHASLAGG